MGKIRYRVLDHTFVICAYQESPYLEECIRSVLHQSNLGNVLIATSTPNQHILLLGKKYHLPVRIRKTPERGIAEDWNFALSCAETPLVTIAHQDDVYGRHYTEEIIRMANQCSHPLLLFTDYAELRNGTTVTSNRLLRVKRLLLMPLMLRSLWGSIFVRRRILSLGSAICCPAVTLCLKNMEMPVFENNMQSNIDWQAWERISRQKGEFAYIGRPLMKHRIHEGSTTTGMLEENARKEEDLIMYRKFWPAAFAAILEKYYQSAEKSNNL